MIVVMFTYVHEIYHCGVCIQGHSSLSTTLCEIACKYANPLQGHVQANHLVFCVYNHVTIVQVGYKCNLSNI